jgi:holo-[acyl-carrier protein] synthase
MIKGIGTDIVSVTRMSRVLERTPNFRDKVFTSAEIAYCESKADPAQSFAACFAAKEAVMKAFGTGWTEDVNWQGISLDHDPAGKPIVILCGNTLQTYEKYNCTAIHISVSHEKEHAIALAILEA